MCFFKNGKFNFENVGGTINGKGRFEKGGKRGQTRV